MKETAFLTPKGKSEAALKWDISSGCFPPYICYQILYSLPEERRVVPTFFKVDLHGADVPLTFICRFYEAECECPGLHLLWVCMYMLAICFLLVIQILYNSSVYLICIPQVQPLLCTAAPLTLLEEQLVGVMYTYIRMYIYYCRAA